MNLIVETYFKGKSTLFLALTALSSWAIVSFGQPAWIPVLGPLAAIVGYALFWQILSQIDSRKKRFYISWLWFAAVQAVQLSWMSSTEYQGKYIYIVYLFVMSALGLQFAWLSDMITKDTDIGFKKIVCASGVWALFEWLRLFFMCGFPFNPIGLSFSCTLIGRQFASFGGVYFLSYWVILTNLIALKFFHNPLKKTGSFLVLVSLLPYVYGALHWGYHKQKIDRYSGHTNALLVQTALDPEKKTGMRGFDRMMPPIQQWSAILSYLRPYEHHRTDLIVLPECSVPFDVSSPLFTKETLQHVISYHYGMRGEEVLSEILGEEEMGSNATLSQFLADYHKASVIVGLQSFGETKAYASAVHFRPHKPYEIYHKRVLLPIVEYLPFKWCRDLAARYHIHGWYEPGQESKVFHSKSKVAPSICIEELYPHLSRKNRQQGAEAFVNITNDVWFPNSRLPKQHYDHGVLRAVENGVPLLRSCNTGITAGVDALGQEVGQFGSKNKSSQWARGAYFVSLSKYSYKTPYLFWGDFFFLSLSMLSVLTYILKRPVLRLLRVGGVVK